MILVAEDEQSVRDMIALALRSNGYDVLLCEDGARAIAELDGDAHIDAVLLDLRMPVIGGAEVVDHIRRSERLRSLPVVAMSAYNDELQALGCSRPAPTPSSRSPSACTNSRPLSPRC